MQTKCVVIGDAGPGGQHANTLKMMGGMDCGPIIGSSKALLCAAITAAPDSKVQAKFYSGGESGELFMHEGAPFKGAGTTIESFPGDYINAMAICDETNRLYVGLSSKKICVYDAQTQEKLCELENAHSKGIYGLAIAPSSVEASFVTCSADNTIKSWKYVEESKSL